MLGALIGAGSKLIGGLFNQKMANRNIELQREFASTGIQRRTEDAEKAGISKLYALGANTQSFSPVAVGGVGGGIAEAGQDIGRAVTAQQSPLGRAGYLATEMAQTQLAGAKLDNDIKRAELLSRVATRGQPGQPPAILDSETTSVVPGQGNGSIKLQKRISPAGPGQPHKSFSVSPEVDMYRTTHGFSPQVPQDLGEAQESQPLAAAQWFMRNNVLPALEESRKTYPYMMSASEESKYYWKFNPLIGEYVKTKRRSAYDRAREYTGGF